MTTATRRLKAPAKKPAAPTRSKAPAPTKVKPEAETNAWFSPAALKFLRSLERNNRREWFEPRKPEFEHELKRPMLHIIEKVTEAMAEFSLAHVRPAQKCMMRIYRDTRFSSDKSPYKRNIAAWWSCEGLEKTSGGGFYFHLSGKEVVIAAGVYMPEREQLTAIRTYLLDHHQEVRQLLNDKKLRRQMGSFDGLRLTRPPKGFPKEHPAMDLILCRQWGLGATLPPETALSKDFVREIVQRFRLVAPLVEALNTPLVQALKRNRRVLFPMNGRILG
jgi:uncharacterized protein (TIGR02453 family)